MRRTPILLPLLLTAVLLAAGAARAEVLGEAASFRMAEASLVADEAPVMRVICLGDAMAPELLRHTYQSGPEGRLRAEVIRTSATRRPQPRAAAQQAPRPARLPVLRLPCISG